MALDRSRKLRLARQISAAALAACLGVTTSGVAQALQQQTPQPKETTKADEQPPARREGVSEREVAKVAYQQKIIDLVEGSVREAEEARLRGDCETHWQLLYGRTSSGDSLDDYLIALPREIFSEQQIEELRGRLKQAQEADCPPVTEPPPFPPVKGQQQTTTSTQAPVPLGPEPPPAPPPPPPPPPPPSPEPKQVAPQQPSSQPQQKTGEAGATQTGGTPQRITPEPAESILDEFEQQERFEAEQKANQGEQPRSTLPLPLPGPLNILTGGGQQESGRKAQENSRSPLGGALNVLGGRRQLQSNLDKPNDNDSRESQANIQRARGAKTRPAQNRQRDGCDKPEGERPANCPPR